MGVFSSIAVIIDGIQRLLIARAGPLESGMVNTAGVWVPDSHPQQLLVDGLCIDNNGVGFYDPTGVYAAQQAQVWIDPTNFLVWLERDPYKLVFSGNQIRLGALNRIVPDQMAANTTAAAVLFWVPHLIPQAPAVSATSAALRSAATLGSVNGTSSSSTTAPLSIGGISLTATAASTTIAAAVIAAATRLSASPASTSSTTAAVTLGGSHLSPTAASTTTAAAVVAAATRLSATALSASSAAATITVPTGGFGSVLGTMKTVGGNIVGGVLG